MARARVHLVPAVLALANPPWQRDVWLDPEAFEDLASVIHTLFDDFCDAEHPERYLGIGLRSEEEAVLLRELDRALTVAEAQAPGGSDEEMLRVQGWGRWWPWPGGWRRSWLAMTSTKSSRCTRSYNFV